LIFMQSSFYSRENAAAKERPKVSRVERVFLELFYHIRHV